MFFTTCHRKIFVYMDFIVASVVRIDKKNLPFWLYFMCAYVVCSLVLVNVWTGLNTLFFFVLSFFSVKEHNTLFLICRIRYYKCRADFHVPKKKTKIIQYQQNKTKNILKLFCAPIVFIYSYDFCCPFYCFYYFFLLVSGSLFVWFFNQSTFQKQVMTVYLQKWRCHF